MPINSKQKGNRGERLLRDLFRGHGYEARRGQQFSGSPDSPDVVINAPSLPIHIECKFTQNLNVRVAHKKAADESSPDKFPTVFWKKNNEPWLITLEANHFFELLRRQ